MNPRKSRFNLNDQRKRPNNRRIELADIQSGVILGFYQVEQGMFASGSGQEAIERAFERAAQGRAT